MGRVIITAFLILMMAGSAHAATIFFDDFSDGDTNGWTFNNTYPSTTWAATGGALYRTGGVWSQSRDFALISGITTPDRFKLETDIMVANGYDFGHGGLFWGAIPPSTFNCAYLQLHEANAVWNYSYVNEVPGYYGVWSIPGGLVNDRWYHLGVDVDRFARMMTVTLDNYSTTYSGSDFDQINMNSGGELGLLAWWNDHVVYDNVRLSAPDTVVPEPATMALFGIGAAAMAFARRKRRA